MGGGKGGSSSSGAADTLANLSKQLFNEGKPVRKGIDSQIMDILGGGTAASTLPMAQTAISNSKQAESQALQQIGNGALLSKIAGTPFAENIASQARMTGNQATAGIPSQIAQFFLSGFAPEAWGSAGQGLSGLGTAGQLGVQKDAASLGMLGDLGKAAGSIFGKGGAGGGASSGGGILSGLGSIFGKSGTDALVADSIVLA